MCKFKSLLELILFKSDYNTLGLSPNNEEPSNSVGIYKNTILADPSQINFLYYTAPNSFSKSLSHEVEVIVL